MRQATPRLRQTERLFQNTATHQAGTACDISNGFGTAKAFGLLVVAHVGYGAALSLLPMG